MSFVLPLSVEHVLASARKNNHTIVLATGVFDLLHDEHTLFLEKASQVGNVLIVGLESDKRVKKLKGDDRPIWNQDKRKAAVEQLPFVTAAFVLPEQFSTPEDHQQLIRAIQPNILAVSSHSPHLEAKQRIMNLVNGEVRVVHEHNPKVSTTKLVGK